MHSNLDGGTKKPHFSLTASHQPSKACSEFNVEATVRLQHSQLPFCLEQFVLIQIQPPEAFTNIHPGTV